MKWPPNMPTTLPQVLLFVVLLLPGVAYLMLWEHRATLRRPSPFRETAAVVLGSALAELAALIPFALFRTLFPHATPDVGRLIREGDGYIKTHYASLAVWGLALLALAVAFAILAARYVTRNVHPTNHSAWSWMFNHRRQEILAEFGTEPTIKVACIFSDGSQIEGTLAWFNKLVDDITDRDFILVAPLEYKTAEGLRQHLPSHAICVSARDVRALLVRYVVDSPDASLESPPAAASADVIRN
jgi:hypothetical protein